METKILSGTKYIYIGVMFVLMAGFFHPLITESPPDQLMYGTLTLFLGLGAVIPLYKAARIEKGRPFNFGLGIGILAISLVFIFILTGRV